MSSVLFVEKRLRTDKLGILYLSSILKAAGHTVDMIQDDIDNVEAYLENHPADFIMYSATTGEHQWFIDRNRELKQQFRFISVMGGPHFTFFPEDVEHDDAVDFVVQGPGEGVILDLVEGRLLNKLILAEPTHDIDALPYPDRSILYKYDEFGKSRMKRFIAARYCLHNCRYCFNHLFKKIFRDHKAVFSLRTSPDQFIEEIIHTRETYGLELAYFNDDDLAGDHEWLIDFCRKFKKRVGLPFCGSIRASSVDERILTVMADAGCTFLNIALESANKDTQKFLNRGNISNEQIESACTISKRLGIKVRLQNMIGLPVDNPLEDALETLRYNQKIDPTDSWASIYQPFPKTSLWEYCLSKNLIDSRMHCVNFYERTCLNIPDAEKINALHKWWFFIVKHQLSPELVKVLIELPLSQDQESHLMNVRWDVAKHLLYGMN